MISYIMILFLYLNLKNRQGIALSQIHLLINLTAMFFPSSNYLILQKVMKFNIGRGETNEMPYGIYY